MKTRNLLLGLIAGLLLSSSAFGEEPVILEITPEIQFPKRALRNNASESLSNFDLLRFDTAEIRDSITQATRIRLELRGVDYEIELTEINVISSDLVHITEDGTRLDRTDPELGRVLDGIRTYSGKVIGEPESIVTLFVSPDSFYGEIETKERSISLENPSVYTGVREPGLTVVSDETDVIKGAIGTCGVEDPTAERSLESGKQPYVSPTSFGSSFHSTLKINSLHSVLKIGILYDHSLWNDVGSSYHGLYDMIVHAITSAQSIYQNSNIHGNQPITFSLTEVTGIGPAPVCCDANDMLDYLRNRYQPMPPNVDTYHWFTNRGLNGTTVGLAYTGVICNNEPFSFGVDERVSGFQKLFAHELGHNFSATHVSGADCDFGAGQIMCPTVQITGASTFRTESQNRINGHISSYGNRCLAPRGAFVWEHSGLQGAVDYVTGQLDYAVYPRNNVGNNQASSIEVTSGCQAFLSVGSGGGGASFFLSGPAILNFGGSEFPNDQLSFVAVLCDSVIGD